MPLSPSCPLCWAQGIMVAWTGQQRLRLGLAERPPTLADDVELFVEVRPRWPIGDRDSRSTTQQQQLSKRKQGHPAGDGAAKRAK